jgi:hypothetical protein
MAYGMLCLHGKSKCSFDSGRVANTVQECSGPFEGGRYFLRGECEDPVCVRCEERRLKA